MLSKPVSRQSFILSKLVAGSLGVLVTMVLIPGVLAYIILMDWTKKPDQSVDFPGWPGNYIPGPALLPLSLTLMLGTFFSQRGPVIGIVLALLFLQQYIIGLVPALRFILPWTLVVPLNNTRDAMVPALLQGLPVTSYLPLIGIIVLIILFVVAGMWRFNREEF